MSEHKGNQNMDFKMKLDAGFWRLQELGFFAKQNFWCCQSCAGSARAS